MERILIIEDDVKISSLLSEALRQAGYSCTQAFSAIEGILYVDREPFSLVILDSELSGLDVKDVKARIQNLQPIPIINVSVKYIPEQNRLLFSCVENSDETFEVQRLIVRVGAMVNSYSSDKTRKPQLLRCRDLILDTSSYTARINEKLIPLTKQEFKILELLFSCPEHIFTKQEIYSYAWDDLYIGEEKTINVHISNIRHKLKAETHHDFIETVWGTGFRMRK